MSIRPVALALLCALAVSGCASTGAIYDGNQVNSLNSRASAVPLPLPPPRPVTRADAAVARTSAELAEWCTALRVVTVGGSILASGKVQTAANYARVVVETVCASPPSDVRTALETVGRAYEAVTAAARE